MGGGSVRSLEERRVGVGPSQLGADVILWHPMDTEERVATKVGRQAPCRPVCLRDGGLGVGIGGVDGEFVYRWF